MKRNTFENLLEDEQVSSLIDGLEQIDISLVEMKKQGNEENVKNMIVVPFLEVFGWKKIQNMDFEHHVLRNKRADIALFLDKNSDTPNILVETKKLYENLDIHVTQALLYAFDKGVEYVLLTNGGEFRVYKSFIPNTTENERLLKEINRTELRLMQTSHNSL